MQKGREIAESLLQKNTPQVEEGTRLIAISHDGDYRVAQFVSAISVVNDRGQPLRVDNVSTVTYLPGDVVMIDGREAVKLQKDAGFVFIDGKASLNSTTIDSMSHVASSTSVPTQKTVDNPEKAADVSQAPTSLVNLQKIDQSWAAFAALVSPEQKNTPRYQALLSSYESYKRLSIQAGVEPQALEQQKAEFMSLLADLSKRIDTRTAEYAAMSREINQINALLL